jgi:hypothetical protein
VIDDEPTAWSYLIVQVPYRRFGIWRVLNDTKTEHQVELLRRKWKMPNVGLKDPMPLILRKVRDVRLHRAAHVN